MLCPEHIKSMIPQKTIYGDRLFCPIDGCDVVGWGNNSPADTETRRARMHAHAIFDPLWKNGRYSRTKLYRKLANFMRLDIENTHIGFFNKAQCTTVIEFANEVRDGLV